MGVCMRDATVNKISIGIEHHAVPVQQLSHLFKNLLYYRETRERSWSFSGNGISLSVLADLPPLQLPRGNVSRISKSGT